MKEYLIDAYMIVVLIRADIRPYWAQRCSHLYDAIKNINNELLKFELFGY